MPRPLGGRQRHSERQNKRLKTGVALCHLGQSTCTTDNERTHGSGIHVLISNRLHLDLFFLAVL